MPHTFPVRKFALRRPLLSRQELVLVLITMVWGGTFLVIQKAMEVSGPLFFVGLRFVIAGLILAALFHRLLRGTTRVELVGGVVIGVSLFLGYFLQTWGLQTISSSTSAFITALYVPLVPLLQWVALRRPPHVMSWAGIALAFTGLVLMTGQDAGSLRFSQGEIATILCALAVAVEIILISRYAGRVDSRRVTAIQLLVAGFLSFGLMPIAGEAVPAFSWQLAASALGLAAASAGIQLAMNWAQRSVSPTRATLIYAGEPVWAGIVGRIAGERLPSLALLGAALILAGVLASELRPKWRRPEKSDTSF
ncbi:DMT family transporter [Terrihabitans sp. B22-R8]|uniref:DMT family transporter n=1 Tax=Terrihabitans sp. B22-R8 TaxID=3425128 RepID=UPI00403CB80E